MEAQTSLITRLLKLLTPEEINNLTTTSDSSQRVPLRDIISFVVENKTFDYEIEENKKEGAKIIPFVSKEEKEAQEKLRQEQEEEGQIEQKVEGTTYCGEKLEAFFANNKGLYSRRRNEKVEGMETSLFIIKEKLKFEQNRKKMKTGEVFQLYKKASLVDIDQEKKLKDDLSQSSQKGVLVNKKQA